MSKGKGRVGTAMGGYVSLKPAYILKAEAERREVASQRDIERKAKLPYDTTFRCVCQTHPRTCKAHLSSM